MRHLTLAGILLLIGVAAASADTPAPEPSPLCVAEARLDVPHSAPAAPRITGDQITIHWNVDPAHVEPFATRECRGAPPELQRPLSLRISRCEADETSCTEILNLPLADRMGTTQITSPGVGEYEFRLHTDPGFHLKRVQLKESDEVHLNWTARTISGRVRAGSTGVMAMVGFGQNAVAVSDQLGIFRIATEELPKETRIIVTPCDAGGVVFVELEEPITWERELDVEIPPAVEVYVDAPENVTPVVNDWVDLPNGSRRPVRIEPVDGRWIYHPQEGMKDWRKEACASAPNHEKVCKEVLATTRNVRLTLRPNSGPLLVGFNPRSVVIGGGKGHRTDDQGQARLASAPSALDAFAVIDADGSLWTFRGSDLQQIESGTYRVQPPPSRMVTVRGHRDFDLAIVGVIIDGVVVPPAFTGSNQDSYIEYESEVHLNLRVRREVQPYWETDWSSDGGVRPAEQAGPLRFAVEVAPDQFAIQPLP